MRIFLILILMLCLGCGGGSSAESSVPVGEGFDVDLGRVVVHVCAPGGCGLLDGRAGWAGNGNIYVRGYVLPSGLVVVEKWITGHEIQHLMHWADGRVADPDLEG